MTLAEAQKVGFGGVPEPPPGLEMRLVAVASRDAESLSRAFENSEVVSQFRMHEVG